MRKKFVVYYHKLPLKADPFISFKKKRAVYHDLFLEGTKRGHEMFLASGKENFLGGMSFQKTFRYADGIFAPYEGVIQADAIYDRSGGVNFPDEDTSARTLNGRTFKLLCNDKNATKELLSDFMPKSFAVRTREDLRRHLEEFSQEEYLVFKPAKGMCGEGILIDTPQEIAQSPLQPDVEYVLQEFIDTASGIPGITDRRHDLRIVIVNGKITLAHVRTPKEGSLLANVAQGGSLQEIPINTIPPFIMRAVERIQDSIDPSFGFPIYSIDFGIQNGNAAFVFELNDQIGFPRENMKARHIFVKNIIDSLEKKASLI